MASVSGTSTVNRPNAALEAATAQRMATVARTLVGTDDQPVTVPAAELLHTLAVAVAANPSLDRVWRLVVAVTGSYPDTTTVHLVRRRLRLATPTTELTTLLDALLEAGVTRFDPSRRAELVERRVIVDVDFCATQALHNTGIQRVVRQTMRRWSHDRPVTLAAWGRRQSGLRTLTDAEASRVVSWGDHKGESVDDATSQRLLVPYRCVVVLPEVAQQPVCAPLEALAALSGNDVAMVVHDCIPIGSADSVPPVESERFTKYLAVVKSASVVAAVSETATAEFTGFAEAVAAQGLRGPRVINVSLPVDAPDARAVTTAAAGDAPADGATEASSAAEPLVLVVGSHEPRKNHDAIVFAAERLWEAGLGFRLRFIGGGSRYVIRRFDRRVRSLAKRGRAIEVWRSAEDDELLASYQAARFTMFPSLHEGFGLPVAESLAFAVPVVTSDYGSTAEIARDGGCLVIDPRNDDAILGAMRALLTDDVLHARLVAECYARAPRTWGDYADELWNRAVGPLLEVSR
jgi:glycosyltransferase involved in cell wall biosynthesis